MRSRSVFVVLVSLVFLLMSGQVRAQAEELPNVALVPHASGGYAPDSVLVKFKPSANASQKARARGLVNAASKRGYGIVKNLEKLKLKPNQSVSRAVKRLSRLPFVEYAEPDYLVQAATNDQYYGLVYAIENTGQSINGTTGVADADMDVVEAWSIQTGDPNLIIAVIDEGVQWDHPDLANNMWRNPGEVAGNGIDDDGNGFVDDVYGYDFYSNDGDPMDEGGHGTHVAGTICADTNNSIGIAGVVHQCKIMALRFLGPQGVLPQMVLPRSTTPFKWERLSLTTVGVAAVSRKRSMTPLRPLGMRIIFSLAAAGNGGSDGIGDNNDSGPHYPSNYNLPNVISVAATDNRDQIAGFSNYGAVSVDIGAPGVDIASTYINDGYVWNSGTSMATPNVTGVVALIRSEFPSWNYQQVIDHLYATARPAASMQGVTTTGGIANAAAAMAGGEPPTPPAAPSGLSATATSDSTISLAWSDNSDNESAFQIERNGQVLSSTAASNSTSFEDTGLAGETLYSYRVRARNSAGDSAWSNAADATTDAPPPYQTILVSSESTLAGTIVAGNYTRTFDLDGSLEQIRERESGGKRNRRYSYMDHQWSLSSPSGAASLSVTGYSGNSSDGDRFELAYSTGGGFTTFCTLEVGASSTCSTGFDMPTAGTVTVRVSDTNQARGARALDSVFIDQIQLFVESNTGPVTLPEAPSGLSGDASTAGVIALSWTDNADNETSYTVQRSDDGNSWSTLASLGTNAQSYNDSSVASLTTYFYRVLAGNSAGDAASNTLQITSAEQVTPSISLSASGYKTKGWQNVDANWDAGGAAITLYRNSTAVYSGSASAYTDSRISKGGAVYDYQACPQGDARGSDSCSNVVTIVF